MKLVYNIIYRVMKVKSIDSSKSTSIENHSGDLKCYMMVLAALSSLALFHNEDVFITLPGSLLCSIKVSIWKWSSTLNVCTCAVNTWTTYRYIHTYIHTYIHKYSDFLVAMISVGLAQARPNNMYTKNICRCQIIIL